MDIQGKQIGFVGDQGNGRYPVPFLLPERNLWTWLKTRYLQNTASFGMFYADEANKDKLWLTGAGDKELTEAPLPRLLSPPTFVAEFLGKQGGACLPHKLRQFISDHIHGGESQIPPAKWQLVLDWCLVASQEKDGTSLLNIGAPELALFLDPEFLEWCEQCLATTLGPEARPMGHAQGGGNGDLHLVKRITSNMGRSFLAGIQALAPSIAGAARQGGNTKNKVATLKGYCGVANPAGIPTIWDAFQQTNEIASHRHNLRVTMFKWTKDTSKDIDKAPFFTEQMV
jgi:hypothetical protein